jgi:hypothetical protein
LFYHFVNHFLRAATLGRLQSLDNRPKVDVLPMVKYYMDQLGVYGLFAKYVPKPKQCPVDPAQILSIRGAIMVDSCFADAGSFGKEKSAFFLQWRSISFDSRVLMGAF